MASRLNDRDRQLLNAYQTKRVGEKPYEDGLWASQGNKDFAYLEVYDDSNNLIDFRNLSTDKFSLNDKSLIGNFKLLKLDSCKNIRAP